MTLFPYTTLFRSILCRDGKFDDARKVFDKWLIRSCDENGTLCYIKVFALFCVFKFWYDIASDICIFASRCKLRYLLSFVCSNSGANHAQHCIQSGQIQYQPGCSTSRSCFLTVSIYLVP